MKFRKTPSSSPKMELLSRRSSGGRMSTLKRSRSFRASVKLMSKLRNHANLRMTVGFDPSPTSRDLTKKEGNLRIIEESRPDRPKGLRKNPENTSPRVNDKTSHDDDAESPSSSSSSRSRKTSVSDDSREIAKDLKCKLSLAERIMGKVRKDASSAKDESVKSPKVIRIFRRKHSTESSRGKEHDKHVSCETDTCQPNKQASYENPVYLPDSSLDSSVSSFLFEVGEEAVEEEEAEKQDCESGRDVLTVIVDSHRPAINQPRYRKASCERDQSEEHVEDFEGSRDAFRRRCETDPSRCPCEARANGEGKRGGGEERASSGYRRIAESFSGFDRSRVAKFHCKTTHDTCAGKDAKVGWPQDQRSFDKRANAACPSKSCGIRTVDNIANFWTSGRAGSFRSKMATGKKRQDAKEARDYEQVGRVLASTSSGSSTLDQ